MRDIRQDLKDRLMEIRSRRSVYESALEKIDAEEKAVVAFLELEESRWTTQSPLPGFPAQQNIELNLARRLRTPLSRFILNSLSQNDKNFETLKGEVLRTGMLSASKFPGRALNFALVSLKNAGIVERVGESWHLREKENPIEVAEGGDKS